MGKVMTQFDCNQCSSLVRRVWSYTQRRVRLCARCFTAQGYTHPAEPSAEWLYQKYIVEQLGCPEIGQMIDRDAKTVLKLLRKHAIQSRPRGSMEKVQFRKGEPNGFNGSMLSEESREKIRQAHKRNGHVPYLKDGKPWMKGRKGELSTNWKGGITPERQAVYCSAEWKEAIKAVWKRDNATCQRCRKHHNTAASRGTFDIHHIVSFEVVGLRCEVSNLVLLCEPCHLWVHSAANVNKEFLG
jgi:hypothetical protein